MHFRCIDYLPPKQGEFKHICSKHTKKIASATQRKASNNSTSSAWPYLAIPMVEGSSLLDFSCCLASFPQAPVRNAKPRQLLFGANNVPLPVHLKTQKPSHCCSQTLPDVLHWREDRKTPLCLLHSALSSVQETVTSCLGPIRECSAEPLWRRKGSAGDSISAFSTLQLMEIAFQYFVEPVILRQNLCWLNWSTYLQNKYRVRPVQRRRGWIPALKGETLLCEATCGNTFSITGHRINSDVSFFFVRGAVCLSVCWGFAKGLVLQPWSHGAAISCGPLGREGKQVMSSFCRNCFAMIMRCN